MRRARYNPEAQIIARIDWPEDKLRRVDSILCYTFANQYYGSKQHGRRAKELMEKLIANKKIQLYRLDDEMYQIDAGRAYYVFKLKS